MYRDHTKVVHIGDRVIGGGNPVLIQSMTNTKTEDVAGDGSADSQHWKQAGCEIIRCTVPTMEAAKALRRDQKTDPYPAWWQTFILIIDWRLLPWKTERIRSASIRAISEARSVCRQWWMWQRSGISRSVSA